MFSHQPLMSFSFGLGSFGLAQAITDTREVVMWRRLVWLKLDGAR
jgi:hypothetical protein